MGLKKMLSMLYLSVLYTRWKDRCSGGGREWPLMVQGSLLFVTYTITQSIISSEMQVELKKNTALT